MTGGTPISGNLHMDLVWFEMIWCFFQSRPSYDGDPDCLIWLNIVQAGKFIEQCRNQSSQTRRVYDFDMRVKHHSLVVGASCRLWTWFLMSPSLARRNPEDRLTQVLKTDFLKIAVMEDGSLLASSYRQKPRKCCAPVYFPRSTKMVGGSQLASWSLQSGQSRCLFKVLRHAFSVMPLLPVNPKK